jgi:hypothetical protein
MTCALNAVGLCSDPIKLSIVNRSTHGTDLSRTGSHDKDLSGAGPHDTDLSGTGSHVTDLY